MNQGILGVRKIITFLAPFLFVYSLVSVESFDYAMKKLINNGRVDSVFFTSTQRDSIEKILPALITSERTAIYGALFRLTNKYISDALIQAHQEGVEIKIVFDGGALSSAKQLMRCVQAGIPLLLYDAKKEDVTRFAPLMHHKFLIFESSLDGRALVSSGSLNLTQAGLNDNIENVMIRDNQEMIAQFKKEFLWLEAHSEKLVSAKALEQKVDIFKTLRSRKKFKKKISTVKKDTKKTKRQKKERARNVIITQCLPQIRQVVQFLKK